MISFNAPTFDPIGSVRYRQEPLKLFAANRRATITATLDGGVSVYDTGYNVGDRQVQVQIQHATIEQIGAMAYLIELYPRLIVATRAGCFSALVEYSVNVRTLTITVRLIEELS